LMRILFGQVKDRLPGYRRLTALSDEDDGEEETMLRVDDVLKGEVSQKV